MRRTAAFLSTLTLASSALAQEPVRDGGDTFASPNGELGAGLSITKKGTARVFGEIGFHTQGQEVNFLGTSLETNLTSLSWILGGGYKITPELELDVMLPMGFGSMSMTAGDESESESGVGVGNLHVGAHWMQADGDIRYKVGGALEWGPWNSDYDPGPTLGVLFGSMTRGMTNVGLWQPEVLTVATPARFEYGQDLRFTGDGAVGIHIPTGGGDFELTTVLAPGVAYYVSDVVLVGARLPMVFFWTESSDMAQLSLEPNARFDLGSAFINARLTLNLDEPLGFAFDDGGVWGLHVGGGGTF